MTTSDAPLDQPLDLPGYQHVYSGKVRDLYAPVDAQGEMDPDRLLLVASNRLSAYDWMVTPEIPDKGEVLTPDSSRFWPADLWEPGHPQPSYDKQFVRDWLTSAESGWDRKSGEAPPELPARIVEQTRAKYVEAYERLTGETF